jgi:hypothetical protein
MSYSILTRAIAKNNTRLSDDQYVDEIEILANKALAFIAEGDTMFEAVKSVVSDSYLVDSLTMSHGIHAHSAFTEAFILRYADQMVVRANLHGDEQTDLFVAHCLMCLDVKAFINI